MQRLTVVCCVPGLGSKNHAQNDPDTIAANSQGDLSGAALLFIFSLPVVGIIALGLYVGHKKSKSLDMQELGKDTQV